MIEILQEHVLQAAMWRFRFSNPSSRTMALGSTQPLTEMSTMNLHWGYRAVGA
jgi:hypothetical protein